MNDLKMMPVSEGVVAPNYGMMNPLLDPAYFSQVAAIADIMACSSLIPESLRVDKPGDANKKPLPFEEIKANCFLITNQALKWKADPFAVAQCCSVVYGRLMFEGKLVAAIIAGNLGIKLHYEYGKWDPKTRQCIVGERGAGDDLAVKVREIASQNSDGSYTFTARSVDGHVGGWKTTGANSPWSKPASQPTMLSYRGAREWTRVFEPAVMVGIITDDETWTTIEHEPGVQQHTAATITAEIEKSRATAREEAKGGFDHDRVQETTAKSKAKPAAKKEIEPDDDLLKDKNTAEPATEGAAAGAGDEGDTATSPAAETDQEGAKGDQDARPLADGDTPKTSPSASPSEEADDKPAEKSTAEATEWLQSVTKMLWAATHFGKAVETLKAQKKATQSAYPGAGIPERFRNKATSVMDRCLDVAAGSLEPADAIEIIGGLTGLDTAELMKLEKMKQSYSGK